MYSVPSTVSIHVHFIKFLYLSDLYTFSQPICIQRQTGVQRGAFARAALGWRLHGHGAGLLPLVALLHGPEHLTIDGQQP